MTTSGKGRDQMIPKAPFGRTGHMSTRGHLRQAAALGRVTQEEADRTLDVLLQYGINHIDTAASYGEAEDRIGPWMPRHRKEFFLATKTNERTYEKAKSRFTARWSGCGEQRGSDPTARADRSRRVEGRERGRAARVRRSSRRGAGPRTRFIGVTGHEVTIPAMHRSA